MLTHLLITFSKLVFMCIKTPSSISLDDKPNMYLCIHIFCFVFWLVYICNRKLVLRPKAKSILRFVNLHLECLSHHSLLNLNRKKSALKQAKRQIDSLFVEICLVFQILCLFFLKMGKNSEKVCQSRETDCN